MLPIEKHRAPPAAFVLPNMGFVSLRSASLHRDGWQASSRAVARQASSHAVPGQASSHRGAQLAVVLLYVALFARVLTSLGAPAVVNFLHFGVAAGAVVVVGPLLRSRAARALLCGLAALLSAICVSALWNGAGLINALLDFILLAEPFLLLLLLVPGGRLEAPGARRWIHIALFAFVVVHTLLAFNQAVATGFDGDEVKGAFVAQGAGHHVAGAVALTGATYLVLRGPFSLAVRLALAIPIASVTVLSDSKQVVAVFLGSVIVLAALRLNDLRRFATYALVGGTVLGALVWAAGTAWPALAVWADADRIEVGLTQKLSVLPLVRSHHVSPVNHLVGIGPGHSVGRLAKMLPAYSGVLEPLGATIHPATQEASIASQGHWVSNAETGSSIWALFFFWAGLWGDLGLIGVLAYLALWWVVWTTICSDDLSRFFLINVLAFGVVFTWLEEPGYMLFVTALMGLSLPQAVSSRDSVGRRRRVTS